MRGVASQLDDRAEGHTWSRWSVDSEQLVGEVGDRAIKSRSKSWRRAGDTRVSDNVRGLCLVGSG